MNWRRSLGALAVFVAMSGILLGSETEKLMQVRESDLAPLIQGKRVTLYLVEGSRVEGRVRKVTNAALVVRVKKSSQLAAYPKGQIEIPRASVFRIEGRDLNKNLAAKKAKHTALTVVAALGALVGVTLLVSSTHIDEGPGQRAVLCGIAAGGAVAVLMNLPRRSKNVTLIEIVSDSPGEKRTTPTNKALETSPIDSGAALPLLDEPSGLDQLRLQARRALMRQDLQLDLSGVPVHGTQTD